MAEDFLVNCIAFQIDKYNTNKTRNSASGRFQVHVFACNSYAAVTLHLSIGDNGFIHSMSSVRLQLKLLLRCFLYRRLYFTETAIIINVFIFGFFKNAVS